MRAREFVMKDGYSFDRSRRSRGRLLRQDVCRLHQHSSTASASTSAPCAPTRARSAASRSHEFQVIADVGEDVIAYCPDSATTRPTSNWPRPVSVIGRPRGRRPGHGEVRRPPARKSARTWLPSLALTFEELHQEHRACVRPHRRKGRSRSPRRSCSCCCAPTTS